MPDETYGFTERTYERLAQAGVAPLSVLDVLPGRPTVRRHIGSFLQVAGRDRGGKWLAVALMEGPDDDEYVVTSARYLDDDEITVIARLLGGDS